LLSRRNLLLLALHSLWKNPRVREQANIFKTPTMTISDTKKRLFPLLQQSLSGFVRIPTYQTPRFDVGPLKGVFLIIDTTPTPIPKPFNPAERKLYFNFKKKRSPYAMKTQIAVGLDLKIWDISGTHPHSVHDLTVLRGSRIPAMLSNTKKVTLLIKVNPTLSYPLTLIGPLIFSL